MCNGVFLHCGISTFTEVKDLSTSFNTAPVPTCPTTVLSYMLSCRVLYSILSSTACSTVRVVQCVLRCVVHTELVARMWRCGLSASSSRRSVLRKLSTSRLML